MRKKVAIIENKAIKFLYLKEVSYVKGQKRHKGLYVD